MDIVARYNSLLKDGHNVGKFYEANTIHQLIRAAIRADGEIKQSLLSHDMIVAREQGISHCRKCHRSLGIGIARYNDFLIFQNEGCPAPICGDCADKQPDNFHLAFRRALTRCYSKQFKPMQMVEIEVEE